MSKIKIQKAIANSWRDICSVAKSKGINGNLINWTRLPQHASSIELLGESLKTDKGVKKKVSTKILYLLPGDLSGREMCAWRTDSCSDFCLGTNAGQLAMSNARNAQAWKTILYFGGRKFFNMLLEIEIAAHEKASTKKEYVPAVRLDGTSDVGMARKFATKFPNVTFYDYTKSHKRATDFANNKLPANWHITFSYSGNNGREARKVLKNGGNVAVVFDAIPAVEGRWEAKPLPMAWRGFDVIDGDETDVRFEDKPGCVVGLRFKAIADRINKIKAAKSFVQKG